VKQGNEVLVKIAREEHTSQALRRMAGSMKDTGHACRLQAISFALDGWPRSGAAEFADVDRQTLCDWVERYNEGGVGGTGNRHVAGWCHPTSR
jgi:Winged helix-turn helix